MWPGFIKEIRDRVVSALAGDGSFKVTVAGGTVLIDESTLATSAKQDTQHADLAAILAKLIAAPATEATLAAILATEQSTQAGLGTLLVYQQALATPSTPYESAVLEASAVLKSSGGTFRSVTVDIDPSLTAPVGAQVYWILLMKGSATVPAEGDISANLMRARPVQWVGGIPQPVSIDEGPPGLAFLVGCTICLSLATATTWKTKTLSEAKCIFHGSVL